MRSRGGFACRPGCCQFIHREISPHPVRPAGRGGDAAAGVLDPAGQPDGGRRSRRLCAGGGRGFVYQTVFRNPLASPDVIGVSSGASAGGGGRHPVPVRGGRGDSGLLCGGRWRRWGWPWPSRPWTGRAGTVPSCWRASRSTPWPRPPSCASSWAADPERELASIEYWIMGSLNGVSGYAIGGNLALCAVCVGALFLLHRQIILLSAEEGEARMLGVGRWAGCGWRSC